MIKRDSNYGLQKNLSNSLYDWWLELLLRDKYPHIDFENIKQDELDDLVDEFKEPICGFNESYNTIAKSKSGKIWIRFGKLHHIFDFEFNKEFSKKRNLRQGMYFKDYLPIVDYHIRFPPKGHFHPSLFEKEETKPILNIYEFCNSLQEELSKDFRYTKYFTLPFYVGNKDVKFNGDSYPSILVSILTQGNIDKDKNFSKEFLMQWQMGVFKKINDFYKKQKGKYIWSVEDIIGESYRKIFMSDEIYKN